MLKVVETVTVSAAVVYLGVAGYLLSSFHGDGGFDPSAQTSAQVKAPPNERNANIRLSQRSLYHPYINDVRHRKHIFVPERH